MIFYLRVNNLRWILRVATLALLGVGILTTSARAGVIYSENFDSITVLAPQFTYPDVSAYAAGTYYGVAPAFTMPTGWTVLSNDVYAFQYNGGTNSALELNETGGGAVVQTTVSGLTIGQLDQLSFQYWSDNRVGSYEVDVTINGATSAFTGVGLGIVTGTFNVGTIFFRPTSTSTLMTFAQSHSVNESSPVIDNLTIASVPEPSAFLLLTPCLGLAGLLRRRRNV